ncbi:NUDIX hydrolase [Rhodobacteraceae bacterium]|nr:NUDIX hydrolase [Paracoccaceae bacterium]
MIPRFGEPVRRGQQYRARPGAYAILLRGEDILLTHQARPEPEVQLPGGGIDPGEGAIAALHREVREETGWSIGNIRRIGVYRRFVFMPDYDFWAEKICYLHIARPVLCHGAPEEPHHTAVWCKLEDADAHLSNSADGRYVRQLARGGRHGFSAMPKG